jgi:virginiamycin B lyase
VKEFTIPTSGSEPLQITNSPDGNLWVTEVIGNKIGKITTAGVFTEFLVPTPNSQPSGITAGPDGNLWFAESHKIGNITTSGAVTEFAIPTPNSYPVSITAGPEGNVSHERENTEPIFITFLRNMT